MDMKIYKAEEYGIVPGKHCESELRDFLNSLDGDEEKVIEFKKGDYPLDTSKFPDCMLYITNTAGDGEYSAGETPHKSRSPLYFDGIKNLTVEGNGARFLIWGQATNAVIAECENIKIKDIEICPVDPNMHELKVISKGLFYVDYELDSQSEYEISNGKVWFCGSDYRYNAAHRAKTARYIPCVQVENTDRVMRTLHPLAGCIKIKEISERKIRAFCLSTARFKIGDRYYIYDDRRQYAGIFVRDSKNVVLERVKQSFNYSLAFVAQNTENITLEGVEFAPDKTSGRLIASLADFVQICMCRGKVKILNSRFEGAGDDCLNVHGFHFKITHIDGDRITVKFMHPQSHGFNPLRAGDELAFIDPKTLLECGRAKIIASHLVDEYSIELTIDDALSAKIGNMIEDINACPDLLFSGNTVERIITRGLLITTRGKTVVENNHFKSCSMSGILISDDAASWYESGLCRDVTIKDNLFDYCGENGVLIKPENTVHAGAVHKNITVTGNTFKKCEKACFSIKSSSDITLSGNLIKDAPEKLKQSNCENIITDF
ncbi:MAG: right-handed parallel beta-helix repeat-containing protein [Oscillospiraceae bacterium]|nr:right-handed parallel beta-helix repeat-containing protein [Oscillospiraceae bacterium]